MPLYVKNDSRLFLLLKEVVLALHLRLPHILLLCRNKVAPISYDTLCDFVVRNFVACSVMDGSVMTPYLHHSTLSSSVVDSYPLCGLSSAPWHQLYLMLLTNCSRCCHHHSRQVATTCTLSMLTLPRSFCSCYLSEYNSDCKAELLKWNRKNV